MNKMKEYKQDKNTDGSELVCENDCPYIEIQWQIDNIFISNAVFKLIGNPNTIRFRWSSSERSLIIEPTDNDDVNGISLAEWSDASGDLFIDSPMFIDEIWQSGEWDKSLNYSIIAKYNVPSNVAIFDMKEAVATENIRYR